MAIYDFKCGFCGLIERDVVLPMSHTERDRPSCCGFRMTTHITSAPMVHWKDYEVRYRPVSVPGAAPITSRREEREFMKRHDLVHYDEVCGAPPTQAEQAATHAEMVDSIEKITPSGEIAAQLQPRK